MTTQTNVTTNTDSVSVSRRIAAGLAAMALGAGLLYAVGFSSMSLAHNAAHDTRHAIGFPCH